MLASLIQTGSYLLKRPPVSHVKSGVLRCGRCRKKSDVSKREPLTMVPCRNCGISNLKPYLIRDYCLYEVISKSSTSVLYRAYKIDGLVEEVAVKLLPAAHNRDPKMIDNLIHETELQKQFHDNPYICSVVDYGHEDDEFFSVLEMSRPETVETYIADMSHESQENVVLNWTIQIMAALHHIYEGGYLYRNIKPKNFLLDQHNCCNLLDFSQALPLEQCLRGDTGDDLLGTPVYMSPERIKGMPEDMRSDLYSVGMLLFHILSRKPYHTANDAIATVQKHLDGVRMTNIRTRLPVNISRKTTDLIEKLIKPLPKDRPDSFLQVWEECESILGVDSVESQ